VRIRERLRKPPLHTRFKKGQSGKPRGRPKKKLPALPVAALNEPMIARIDGERRKITKRQAVIHQLVDKSTGADLRTTKMLIDMTKDIEKKAGAAPPPEPPVDRGGRGGDQIHCAEDTERHAARNPGPKRGEPGTRDDFFASAVSRSPSWSASPLRANGTA
jgi:Family of unknown function (DUF5681)